MEGDNETFNKSSEIISVFFATFYVVYKVHNSVTSVLQCDSSVHQGQSQ